MKKLMKIFVAAACVAALALSAVACGNGGASGASEGQLKVGIIQFAAHPSLDNCYQGLIEGLEAAGYKDGEKVKIDFQNAQNQTETAEQIAGNMVAKNYDLIIGIATPAATAAYARAQGTKTQVIFCAVSDPVAAGLVASSEAPGGNCSGTSDLLPLEKQMKMIRAFQPEAKKIGILYTTNESNSVSHLKEFKALAPEYGFEIVEQGVQGAADIPQAAATLAAKVDCINNFTDNNVVTNLATVLAKANEAGIPVYGSEIEQVKNGCMASEGLDYITLGKQTGAMAAKVLGGAGAGTLPVERLEAPTPVVNEQVAAKFQIAIPPAYAAAQKVTAAQ